MAIFGVVADDFTGTASSGMMMAKAQVETGLFFDAKQVKKFEDKERLQAVYASTNSRAISASKAYEAVYEATEVLSEIGVQYYSKKIDTTMRGGIGYEIDAMLDFLGDDAVAVMVTAMPPSKRICVGGYSIIDGVLLTETSIAKDVKTPVKEAFIPGIIQKQSKRSVTLISIEDVRKGKEVLMQKLISAKEQGFKIIVVDAITMEHIQEIAEACVKLGWEMLAVDPGPFTMKLACCRGIASEVETQKGKEEAYREDKTALIIAGSANPSTKKQMEILAKDSEKNKRISVSPKALMDGENERIKEVDRVAKKAKELLASKEEIRSLLIETALHGEVLNLQQEDKNRQYEEGTCSRYINEGLAMISKEILEECDRNRIVGLMLTGGDTMECVCRNIGVTCIKAEDSIVAQVDVGKIIGKYDGMPLIVKGGFCGYDEIGIDIVKRLHAEAKGERI